MNRNTLIAIVVVLVAVIIIFNVNRAGEQIEDLEISGVCFDGDNKFINDIDEGHNCFSVEIADSKEERAKGLMFREELCSDCGMLFVYEESGDYKFWMKNTLIPLDIIWWDSDYRVIHIAEAVPCVTDECELYGPDLDSTYILEVNSGVAKEIGLEIGEGLELVYS